jgi:peptide/nickel transport system permease protein
MQSMSSFKAFWLDFRRNRMGVVGGIMLVTALTVAILAPVIAPYDPNATTRVTIGEIYLPPGPGHLLGTDDAGKDVLTNFAYGARVSLIVGFFASFISIVIGGTIGIIAGFYGGRVENLLMRFTDIMLVIPDLPMAVVLVALTKPSLINIILVIGLLGWTGTARLVRSQTLVIKQRKFVLRARSIGAGNWHIVTHHIFPLVLPLIVVNTVLVISLAILEESTLAFIGLGDPTVLSWGQMLNFAFNRGAMSTGAWWAMVVPGFGIVWIVLGCTLLGQGLEQILNPRVEIHHLSEDRQLDDFHETRLAAGGLITQAEEQSGQPAPVLLDVRGLSVDFLSRDEILLPARAVSDASFTLREGEMLGLVGESGCGKTTLMLSLMRLLPPNGRIVSGSINFMGRDLLTLSEREMNEVRWKGISMIFQGAMNALNPVRTVGNQISEALTQHISYQDRKTVDERVEELLDLVGIAPARKNDYPHQYSGGMRQRAMIAMALACTPQVIIADEPTTALDVMIQAQILQLLADLREKLGLSIVFVTHDLGVVAEVCDSVMVMYGGVVAEYSTVDAIYNHPQHPYTQELLRAFPDLTRPDERLIAIPGCPPRLDDLPPGCRFAPRCSVVFERCQTEMPALHRFNGTHYARCHMIEEHS